MKKRTVIVVLINVLILVSFCACNTATIQSSDSVNRNIIFTEEMCNQLFGCEVYDMKTALNDSKIAQGHFEGLYVLPNNDVKITLSTDDVEYWKANAVDEINGVISEAEQYACDLKVYNDFQNIEAYVSKDNYMGAGLDVTRILPYCAIIQVLNGIDSSRWSVYIEFIDIDNDRVIKSGNFPEDGSFGINEADFNR